MAKISLDNGNSIVDVVSLTEEQAEDAASVAAQNGSGDPAYAEVDGQSHDTQVQWLTAYCSAFERHYPGEVFTIG
jgi:hypothetical protein